MIKNLIFFLDPFVHLVFSPADVQPCRAEGGGWRKAERSRNSGGGEWSRGGGGGDGTAHQASFLWPKRFTTQAVHSAQRFPRSQPGCPAVNVTGQCDITLFWFFSFSHQGLLGPGPVRRTVKNSKTQQIKNLYFKTVSDIQKIHTDLSSCGHTVSYILLYYKKITIFFSSNKCC